MFRPIVSRPTLALFLAGGLAGGAAVAAEAPDSGIAGIDFARFAGGPVPWVRYTDLGGWDYLGGTRIALRTDRGRAYLIEVAPPCTPLAEVRQLGITASHSKIEIGKDEVVVDGRRCIVQRIAPLDLAALDAIRATPSMQRLAVARPRSLDRGPLTPPPDD